MFCPPTPSAPPRRRRHRHRQHRSNAQPKECLPSLMGLMPCKDYLLPTEPRRSLRTKASAATASGPSSKTLPSASPHIGRRRPRQAHVSAPGWRNFLHLSVICDTTILPSDYRSCQEGPVPPLRAAPAPEAAS
ncbi:hypothetical protein ZWY2020_042054 [Hordeum vulgare]|nr:hypothetical protein ZWY2020_042054 [Hordeum vulgare]